MVIGLVILLFAVFFVVFGSNESDAIVMYYAPDDSTFDGSVERPDLSDDTDAEGVDTTYPDEMSEPAATNRVHGDRPAENAEVADMPDSKDLAADIWKNFDL